MRLNFRQGIVKIPDQNWLQKSLDGEKISIIVYDNIPIIFNFIHYNTNYLIDIKQSRFNAWKNLIPGVKQYLYVDIDISTSELSFGFTDNDFILSNSKPLNNVSLDQHWFDLTNKVMKVLDVNNNWVDKIRLFVGIYNSDQTITKYHASISQIDIYENIDAGYILLGENGSPLYSNNLTFATTSSILISTGNGHNVVLDSLIGFSKANENIPSYSIVSKKLNESISLARSNDKTLFAHGIVLEDVFTGNLTQVRTSGVIFNPNWNFSINQIGKNVFFDYNGQISLSRPTDGFSQIIGYVYNHNSIFLNIQSPIRLN